MWCLIVLIPDLCPFSYFVCVLMNFPYCAMGLSVISYCSISWSYSLVIIKKAYIYSSPFIMLYLGSIGMDHVISRIMKRTILQRNYRKMTILWSFSYNIFVKLHGKNFWTTTRLCHIQNCVKMRCVIKGLQFTWTLVSSH